MEPDQALPLDLWDSSHYSYNAGHKVSCIRNFCFVKVFIFILFLDTLDQLLCGFYTSLNGRLYFYGKMFFFGVLVWLFLDVCFGSFLSRCSCVSFCGCLRVISAMWTVSVHSILL